MHHSKFGDVFSVGSIFPFGQRLGDGRSTSKSPRPQELTFRASAQHGAFVPATDSCSAARAADLHGACGRTDRGFSRQGPRISTDIYGEPDGETVPPVGKIPPEERGVRHERQSIRQETEGRPVATRRWDQAPRFVAPRNITFRGSCCFGHGASGFGEGAGGSAPSRPRRRAALPTGRCRSRSTARVQRRVVCRPMRRTSSSC
jgi:hypothetical protein